MTVVEALQWIGRITAMDRPERRRVLGRFAAFYLTDPMRHSACPFLAGGTCTIYRHRTFACRAYGLWSRAVGQARTRESRHHNKKRMAQWQRYGVELPIGRVVHEIDYCDHVENRSGTGIDDGQLFDLFARICMLDGEFDDLQVRFASAYGSDISFLITALLMGHKKAVLGKFAVIKEMAVKGTTRRLDRMIDCIDAAGFPGGRG